MTFDWQDEYSVGVPYLDQQHRKLLCLCKEAEQCLHNDGGQEDDEFHNILHAMRKYAQEHFKVEEALLSMHGYHGLEAHREQHGEFLLALIDFIERASHGDLAKQEVSEFLKRWWFRHILEDDMAYKAFFS